jgi:hypothetical protein
MKVQLTKEQQNEVIALTKKLLKCAGEQHPVILMNAAYMLMQAADSTYIMSNNKVQK